MERPVREKLVPTPALVVTETEYHLHLGGARISSILSRILLLSYLPLYSLSRDVRVRLRVSPSEFSFKNLISPTVVINPIKRPPGRFYLIPFEIRRWSVTI